MLEYNSELVKWVEFSIKDIGLTIHDPWDSQGLKQKLFDLQSQYTNTQIAFWRIFIFTNKTDDEWFNKIWKEFIRILPLHNLTVSLLEDACSISTRLNLEKSNVEISKKIVIELTQKKEEFIAKRNKIEDDAINAIKNTSTIIRTKLRLKYDFE